MSASLTTGIPYHIRSSVYSGGYLQLPLGGQGHLRLGPSPNDESHQWIFRVPNETANGLFIESAQVLDLFATRILGSSESIWLTRQPGVQEYFMVATNASSYYRICQDPGCSSLWVPYYHALGEPRDDLNELAIVRPSTPSPGAENEIWEITPAGGSSPPSSPTSSSSTTSASATPDSPPSSTYQTTFTQGDPPSQTSQVTEPGGLQVLKNCAPCGKAKCSFSSSGPAKKATYSILVGQPVSNCHNKSLETTTTKLGGTFELQETFNVEATVSAGLGFLGPSISTTVGHSTSKKIAQTQEIEVSIRPGQVGALVANVSYTTHPGQMSVDDSTLAFVSIQPEYVLGYSVVYTDCGTNFQALTMPKVECDNGSLALMANWSVLLWILVLGAGSLLS